MENRGCLAARTARRVNQRSCHRVLGPIASPPSGSILNFRVDSRATLETEVAFRFGRTVSPAKEAFDTSMLDRAFVAIEVVCSRYIDRKAVAQPSFVADNLGFHALICGEQIPFADDCSFDEDAGIWRNGERIASTLNGDDRTRPFESLAFLWKEFARQGRTLERGAIVTTGTLSAPVDCTSSANLTARFADATVGVALRFSSDNAQDDDGNVRNKGVLKSRVNVEHYDWLNGASPFPQSEF
ncbi:hypothetical protein [Paraburkholderia sp. RAU6.4a]|uniref:hypothetical protein n=1 Tax=Paraburkholderia sp. RAU6.4a TaxID=2991067 RepID=UPI003D19E0D9